MSHATCTSLEVLQTRYWASEQNNHLACDSTTSRGFYNSPTQQPRSLDLGPCHQNRACKPTRKLTTYPDRNSTVSKTGTALFPSAPCCFAPQEPGSPCIVRFEGQAKNPRTNVRTTFCFERFQVEPGRSCIVLFEVQEMHTHTHACQNHLCFMRFQLEPSSLCISFGFAMYF